MISGSSWSFPLDNQLGTRLQSKVLGSANVVFFAVAIGGVVGFFMLTSASQIASTSFLLEYG